MFNLFNKPKMKTNYPEIVTQIHKEFEDSSAELLKQAEALLDTLSPVNSDKAKRLQSLGFKNVPEVKQVIEAEQKIVSTKAVADLVKYYQHHYPFNKFITDTEVTKICSKYDLVCGDIGLFKGFVPETKLKDIENFKLRKEDQIKILLQLSCERPLHKYMLTDNDLTDHGKSYLSNSSDFVYVTGTIGDAFYSTPIFTQKCIVEFLGTPMVSARKIDQSGFSICAPIKDMDMTGMEVKNYRVVKHIPDPVVLKRVNGGFLIVTAWGNEASDEIVVNAINN